jgi:hypothetical protein
MVAPSTLEVWHRLEKRKGKKALRVRDEEAHAT